MTIFQAVAFDMDGLMFDTEDVYWKAASALLGRRGHEYTTELCDAIMGRPPRYCFELFKETFSFTESWQELQNESENLFLEFLDEGFSPMPGLFELLDFLERHDFPKGICTSSARRVVTEVLRRHDLAKRFRFILTAEDIRNGKPDPEIYRKAASKFGVVPAEMVVFEDSVAGSRSARDAGAFPVVVLAAHNQDGDFSAAKLIVESLDASEVFALFDAP